MKILFFYISYILLICFTNKLECNKLPNGKYLVRYIEGTIEYEYKIHIIGNRFVQYFKNGDSVKGKLEWLDNCDFRMEYNENRKSDTPSGPLKIMCDSWGEPYTRLNEVKKDTIEFRSTFPRNPHITVNEGYFLRIADL